MGAISPGNSVPVLPKRREWRLPAKLNVRVLGIDANGKAFHLPAVTVDISFSGGRITGLAAELRYGDIVGVQSSGGKNRFKVVSVSQNHDGTYQVGLSAVEQGASPWREMLQQAKGGERRGGERYHCNGSVSVRTVSTSNPIWGIIRDISAGGCYVQCVTVPAVGDLVTGQFVVNGIQIEGVAEVRSARATVGMGVHWCDLGWDGPEKLNKILRSLSSGSGDSSAKRMKALEQVERVQQVVSSLRERLKLPKTVMEVKTMGQLNDAYEKLAAALKSVQE